MALASTAQKILPFYLFSLIVFELMVYVLAARVIVRVAGRLNQLETKKLLAYSSIFGAVWILSCGATFSVLAQYLTAYTVALLVIVRPLIIERRLHINERLIKNYKSKVLIYLTGFFSMGGSPPFLGFYAKVIVAQLMLAKGQFFSLLCLTSASVFLLYVYMRFFYQTLASRRAEAETSVSGHFYSSVLLLALAFLIVFPWV